MKPVTLITGASRGIGLGIARRLARDGHRVVNLSRSNPPADFPGISYAVDLADADAAGRALASTAQEHAVDNLINNAALIRVGALEKITAEELQEQIDLNIRAAILCAQAVLPSMRAKRRGRIVNIGSRAALGKEGRSIYGATKAAIASLTRTWALELARDRITVNAIAPGPIETELFRENSPADSPQVKALIAAVPLGRIGQPADVAAAAAFFVSDEASFITGQVLYVCGGLSIYSAPM